MTAIYYGDNRLLVETEDGISCFLNTRDLVMTPTVALKGTWEPQVTRLLRQHLKPGDTFVDVGANIGYHSCVAGNLIGPNGHLVMFEVDPVSVALLRDNLAINRISKKLSRQVMLVEKAVSDRVGSATFYSRDRFASNSSIIAPRDLSVGLYRDSARELAIATTTLDVELRELSRVDLVKIDVEGAEWHVLRGMCETMQRSPRLKVIMEWSPDQMKRSAKPIGEVASFFFDRGYNAWHVEGESGISANDLKVLGYGNVFFHR